MITIFDTNVLVSALLNPRSLPADLITKWGQRQFSLVSSEDQILELRRVSRYPKIANRLTPSRAGNLVRRLRKSARMLDRLPIVDVCLDPMDNYVLAMALSCEADFIVTGDKADLLSMKSYASAKIVSVKHFATVLER